jgi:hypothetical protein
MANHLAAVFVASYFLGYFAAAWLYPNVPAGFRSIDYWCSPSNLLTGMLVFRVILASAATLSYALWSSG